MASVLSPSINAPRRCTPANRRSVSASAAEAPTAQQVTDALKQASSSNQEAAAMARKFRRDLNKLDSYTRRVVNDDTSLQKMETDGVGYSRTGLIARMRSEGNTATFGNVTITLASAYGFCWGVERAVQMAYEARTKYPDRKLYITNEIIHNPGVNERLTSMGVSIIEVNDGVKDFSPAQSGDVVILPAFGASVEEMRLLADRGVQIVDTTCPWVAKVWTAVDKQATRAHTSIIHGKYSHEETVATASFAGDYLIVKDLSEAQYVSDYILSGGDRTEFLSKFKNAISIGFDPDSMLDRVGIANQTTMLKGETEAIGKLFEKTMMQKFGPAELNDHFMVMDTICDATQERQDAMYELTDGSNPVDMLLVVGGFNSSNTSHLQEIGEHKNFPTFWVNTEDCIDVASNTIRHKMSWGELKETSDWLQPGKPLTVGVTSGASTPDSDVERVVARMLKIMDPEFQGVAPLSEPVEPNKPQH